MKYTLSTNTPVIDINSIDTSRHYIAFTATANESGYLVINERGDIVRAVALSLSAANYYGFKGNYKQVLSEMQGDKWNIYVFDNRKEFYQFLADNSK